MCDGLRFVCQSYFIAFIRICICIDNSNYSILLFTRFILSGGDAIGAPLLFIGSRVSLKWLNIVLDLNGVLCQCVERSATSRRG